MAKFAKLIDLEDEQVLAVIKYNDEDDSYELLISTDVDGVRAEVAFGYDEREDALAALEAFQESDAKEMRTTFIGMLESVEDDEE